MTIRPSYLFFLIFFAINAVEWVNANPFSDTTTIRTRFTSRNNPAISIRFVKDSGVCETTPGVHQISGYLDVGTNMSMVSIFFPREHRWLVTNVGFSGSGSLSLEHLRNRLLSHCGMSYSLFRRTQVIIFPRLTGGPGCSSMVGLFQGKRIVAKIIPKSTTDIRFQKMDRVW